MEGTESVDPALIATMKNVALLVFLGFFVVVIARLLRTSTDEYEKDARIPLEDQPIEERGREAER